MAGYNRIIMIGNLTRDPELRQLQSGQSVCRLGLASNRQFKNRQTGAVTQDVCFIDVDVWGAQAESCSQYLQKGRPVLVEGRLKFDNWKDAEGQTRSKYSIVAETVQFLGGSAQDQAGESLVQTAGVELEAPAAKAASATRSAARPAAAASRASAPSSSNKKFDEPPFEDDLPF